MQFSATLTKAAVHLRGIQNGMRLLLGLPKVRPGMSDTVAQEGAAGGTSDFTVYVLTCRILLHFHNLHYGSVE